jgi:protein arginine N-methyltransferase 7
MDDSSDDSEVEGRPYLPPGNGGIEEEKVPFETNVPRNFLVPSRLAGKPYELIEAANDWHYAMMNDLPRNEFYRAALRRVITPDSVVLEIGAGSGLLSIIAASLGAKCVIAIEANRHLAEVARQIVRQNGFEDRIHIINKMSTAVAPDELAHYGTPTILLSEILGTLLLGESALHYVMDARKRLVAPCVGPEAPVCTVPRRGCQFASLIESPDIASITSVRSWEGIDLTWFNTLQDTTSMVFTKQYGFRFSSCKYRTLAPRQRVLDLDFATDAVGVWKGERRQRLQCSQAGVVHAVLATWEVYDSSQTGDELTMSTHPDETLSNFPRDMQWGQGLQLIEDMATPGAAPVPFVVSKGEWLVLVTRFSVDGGHFHLGRRALLHMLDTCQVDGVTMQFQLEREKELKEEHVAPAAPVDPSAATATATSAHFAY